MWNLWSLNWIQFFIRLKLPLPLILTDCVSNYDPELRTQKAWLYRNMNPYILLNYRLTICKKRKCASPNWKAQKLIITFSNFSELESEFEAYGWVLQPSDILPILEVGHFHS
jgi:hypothetical protein